MNKDPLIFIAHILENIEDIAVFSKGLTRKGLEKNKLKRNAIIRSIEIIGEAVKNVPHSFRNKHPDVPWKEIAGARDRMIHQYFDVDLDLVWDIAQKDIPLLKKKIEKIKESLMQEK